MINKIFIKNSVLNNSDTTNMFIITDKNQFVKTQKSIQNNLKS